MGFPELSGLPGAVGAVGAASDAAGFGFDAVVNERVHGADRPCAEVLDRDSLELVAVVYGRTKAEARARAELIRTAVNVNQATAWRRKQLRHLAWYEWAYYRSKSRPFSLATLLYWLIGIVVEPRIIARQLVDLAPPALAPQGGGGGASAVPAADAPDDVAVAERLESYVN